MTNRTDIELLFRENYRGMLILAERLLHDHDAARDIVHDVFAALLSSPMPEVTRAYLLQGVRFACLKHLRHMSVRERVANLLAANVLGMTEESWPDEGDLQQVREIVNRLPERTRNVVKLRFAARLSYKEIAEELRISEVAVYNHLKNALNVLRQNFHHDDR